MTNKYNKYLGLTFCGTRHIEYKITEFIGEGGNGFVFKCISSDEHYYAVKILDNNGKENVKFENFKKEIELQSALKSSYIVKCIDFGELKTKKQTKTRLFYVMEKYTSSLENIIRNNGLVPDKSYKYAIQLCYALKTMHTNFPKLIHRDLKPGNILYDDINDKILICDLGLTHLDNGSKTINNGFVGNINFHAPEQKLNSCEKIGVYTDIYSLGLIINYMFTKEIPQGNNYKKIGDVAPVYSFVDKIIDCMLEQDINKRESDINVILFRLKEGKEKNYIDDEEFYETKETMLIPKEKTLNLKNLYYIAKNLITNSTNWNLINLNYQCDFHFKCNDLIIDSLLLIRIYKEALSKFEYESNLYDKELIPYKCLDINNSDDLVLYKSFTKILNDLKIHHTFYFYKNMSKKIFASLAYYHASELIHMIQDFKKDIANNCLDAPILWCISYIHYCLDGLNISEDEFELLDNIKVIKYEESDVTNKNILFEEEYSEYDSLIKLLKREIGGLSFLIDNNKLLLFFNDKLNEEAFEKVICDIVKNIPKEDIRREDIFDIIRHPELYGSRKKYLVDKFQASQLNINLSKLFAK